VNVEGRDKKALTLGGIAVLVIIVLGYGVIPMARNWSERRANQTSDQVYAALLRESVRSQEATLKQRNALALRMGSLFAPQALPAVPEKKEEEAPAPATPPTASPPPASPPAAEGSVVPEVVKPGADATTAPPAGVPPPPSGDPAKPPTPEPGKPGAGKAGSPKPEPPASSTLAGYVEQQAKKSGATVKRITPKKSSAAFKGTKRFHAVTLQVSFECNVQNLVEMLKALEKGERFVRIDQFQLKRDLAGGDKLDVTMDLHSYEAGAGAA
jgi:hypothetical protein